MARTQVAENLDEVKIAPRKKVHISAVLIETLRDTLIEFLVQHRTALASSHLDIEEIDPNMITHQLSILTDATPIRQKKRTFAPERNQAVAEEVGKLLATNFIREVYYPDWLSNVVIVKKANGKWRMWVNFKDLNCSCLKDSFPLPLVDLLVDSMLSLKCSCSWCIFRVQPDTHGYSWPRENGICH